MRRYWIEPQKWKEDLLEISGDEYHHIFKVCRTEQGERFEVLGDDESAFLVEVLEVGKKEATVKRLSKVAIKPLSKPELHLCLSIPRPQILPLILEKSVELGVHTVHLFYSERSYFRNGQASGLKWGKFNKVITKALQQSGRGHKMPLEEPVSLKEKLAQINRKPNVQCLFPFEGVSQENLKERLQKMKSQKPEQIYFFVGSEGGFSANEVSLMQEAGLKPVSLGSQVLRVETACVTVASVLKYEFDLMNE